MLPPVVLECCAGDLYGSSGNAALLAEKLQFPGESGAGGPGVRENGFAERLGRVLTGPVALPFTGHRQPVHRDHAGHRHAANAHLVRLDADAA